MNLLVDGILIEEKHYENGFLKEMVRFVHPHVFEYFLFKEILERHSHRMDDTFFEFIFNEYVPLKQHYALLEWSIFQFVKHHEFDLVKHVLNLNLTCKEQNQLLLFMAENLKHLAQTDPDSEVLIKSSTLHRTIVNKLFELDFLDPAYQKIISILCETTSDENILAIYHSILTLFDCMTFNVEAIKKRIITLQALTFTSSWQITPLEFSEFLVSKLTGSVTYNNEIFNKIDHFSAKNPSHHAEDHVAQMSFRFSKFYLVLLNWLFGIQLNQNSAIDKIYQSFPLVKYKSKSYMQYLIHILALEAAKNEPGKKAKQLERIVNHIHQFPLLKGGNCWSMFIYQLILGYQYYNRKEYDFAKETVERGIVLFKENHYTMLELMSYQLMIKIYFALNDVDKINEYRCLVFSTLEKNKIDERLFDFDMQQMVRSF